MAWGFRRSREPRYSKIDDSDWDDASDISTVGSSSPSPPKLSWRRNCFRVRVAGLSLKTLVGFAASIYLLLLLVFASTCDELSLQYDWRFEPPLPTQLPKLSPNSNSDPTNLKLRMILPADDPGANLCKEVLSLAANKYPAPVIVNFGRHFDKDGEDFGASHLAKIDGTLEMLDALLSETAPADERLTEDDIVAVVDAYDVWFQLPPEVLIKRFHEQNALADARLRSEWGPSLHYSPLEGLETPSQSVIIATQKKCWPTRTYGDSRRCDAMPPSPVRPDMYGPMTDVLAAHDRRPRHVNSGGMIGTAGAMRRLFRQAQIKVQQAVDTTIISDQFYFAQVIADQEVWRDRVRDLNTRIAEATASIDIDATDAAAVEAALDDATRTELEQLRNDSIVDYGIGLDHVQDIFMATVYSEPDGEYILLNDSEVVHASSIAHGVYPVRVEGVPDDVDSLPRPMNVAGLVDKDGSEIQPDHHSDINLNLTDLPWSEVPLYTDYWTTKVPVAVHHNAHKRGLKPKRLHEWWELPWYFPYLRRVAELIGQKQTELPILANVDGRDGNLVYKAPPSDLQKPLPRVFNPATFERNGLEETGLDVLCGGEGNEEWWDEVFRDGLGPLRT